VGGFPLRDCARIMIAAALAHEPRTLRLVRFVLFGQQAYHAFAEVGGELLGPPAGGVPDCPVSG
jgi:O-acetyl-ADP-ribose deacetylase (regulator of RNase III)